jgi:hypothetical protein
MGVPAVSAPASNAKKRIQGPGEPGGLQGAWIVRPRVTSGTIESAEIAARLQG